MPPPPPPPEVHVVSCSDVIEQPCIEQLLLCHPNDEDFEEEKEFDPNPKWTKSSPDEANGDATADHLRPRSKSHSQLVSSLNIVGVYNPMCSSLALNPERRWFQPWTFLTYSLVHKDFSHLFYNVIIQLMVGLPLEMVHGSARVAAIYCLGILGAALARSHYHHSHFVPLVGASGKCTYS